MGLLETDDLPVGQAVRERVLVDFLQKMDRVMVGLPARLMAIGHLLMEEIEIEDKEWEHQPAVAHLQMTG
jgi:hypothetical protein